MNTLSDHVRGVLLATTGILILSPDALILRLVEADLWTLVFWRGLLTALALAIFFVVSYPRKVLTYIRAVGGAGLLASVFFSITSILFVTAITLTTVSNTLVIISAASLFAAILSLVFLRERIPRRTWIAAITAFAGITVIFSGSLGGGALLGDICALGTALFIGAHLTVIRYARAINMVPTLALSGIITAVIVLPLAAPLSIGTHDFVLLSLLGLVILPIATGMIILAPRFLPAAEVSLIMLLETVFGPLWVWLVLNERPSVETFLGGAVVLGTLAIHAVLGLRQTTVINGCSPAIQISGGRDAKTSDARH
ncbi:MAG: DMT family transporter [Acidiferrobacterales bacterium]